jgi:hypothetical protein
MAAFDGTSTVILENRRWTARAGLAAAAMLALSWLDSAVAGASEGEEPAHRLSLEASTLALGTSQVYGDDDHYGSNQVWAAPGIGADYRYSLLRHLAIGAVLELQGLVGSKDVETGDGETRTFTVARGELMLLAQFPLDAGWQIHTGGGVGPDFLWFKLGDDTCSAQGEHLALRAGVSHRAGRSLGGTAGFVTALGAGTIEDIPEDSYTSGADTLYLTTALQLGVVWWPG